MVSVETLLSKYYPHLRDPSVKHGFRLDVVLAFKIFFSVFYGNPFFSQFSVLSSLLLGHNI